MVSSWGDFLTIMACCRETAATGPPRGLRPPRLWHLGWTATLPGRGTHQDQHGSLNETKMPRMNPTRNQPTWILKYL